MDENPYKFNNKPKNIEKSREFKIEKGKPQNFDDIKSKIENFKQMKKDFDKGDDFNFEVSREALNKYKKVTDSGFGDSQDFEVNKRPAKSEGQISPRSQKPEFINSKSRYSNLDSLFDKVNDKVKKNRSNTPSFINLSPSGRQKEEEHR
jgi:hypothetical protein